MLATPYCAWLSRPPPSTTTTTFERADISWRKAAMRSGASAVGGAGNACCNHSPTAALAPSQMPAAPTVNANHPTGRRQPIRRVPSSISSNSGTGGQQQAAEHRLPGFDAQHQVQVVHG